MATYALPNVTTGVDTMLIQTASAVPLFIPLFLAFIYLMILIGGSLAQKRGAGVPDIPMWATLAGLATLMVSLVLSLSSGLMQPSILGVVVAITIASSVWLFLDRNRNEI